LKLFEYFPELPPIKQTTAKKIRRSGDPASAGPMTLRPCFTTGLPFRNCADYITLVVKGKDFQYKFWNEKVTTV